MSEIFSLLSNALLRDPTGCEVGEVVGVHYVGGHLSLTVILFEEEGPDEGVREPQDRPVNLSLVGGANGN
jgi:hypothetical protein